LEPLRLRGRILLKVLRRVRRRRLMLMWRGLLKMLLVLCRRVVWLLPLKVLVPRLWNRMLIAGLLNRRAGVMSGRRLVQRRLIRLGGRGV
jgi:hypothetical protein